MFLKLLKYEFKSVGKWYLGLYSLVGALSLIIGIWMSQRVGHMTSDAADALIINGELQPSAGDTLLGLLFSFFIILICGLLISTTVLIVIRFKRSIFDRQGYLTMTLPVNIHAIILSKLTAALLWNFLALVALVASLLLIVLPIVLQSPSVTFAHLLAALPNIFELLFTPEMLMIILGAIIASASATLMMYAAIALAHLADNRRTFYGFLIYFGLLIAVSFIAGLLRSSLGISDPDYSFIYGDGFNLISNLIFGGAFYASTYYIIKNKLNIT